MHNQLVFDELPFWFDGKGIINKKRDRLYLFDVTKNTISPISSEFSNVEFYSCFDSLVLFTTSSYTDIKETSTGLYLYDINTEKKVELVKEGIYNIVYAGYLDGKIMFVGSDMKRFGLNENPNFYIIENKKIKFLCKYDNSFGNTISTDCINGEGRQKKLCIDGLYFLSTVKTSTHLKKVYLDGSVDTIIDGIGSIECFDISNNQVFYIGLRKGKLQELYTIKNHREIKLTTFNEEICKNKRIMVPEKIHFKNDGIDFEGNIIKPDNFKRCRKYPAILFIHGGPKIAYGDVCHHDMQCLANEGYFVFYTNPRGSDGRGDNFANIVGLQGTLDYDDLMKFTDVVLDAYSNIDANRIGVTGYSYGGFMTNWIIGHTNRFRCAVSERGIANWITKISTSDIGYHYNVTQLNATPWSDAAKLWFQSPMRYADKIITPTLFIHGAEDYRCWLVEGIQMFFSLKYHGVETRLVIIDGESHEINITGRPWQRIERLIEIIEWFNKYLQ